MVPLLLKIFPLFLFILLFCINKFFFLLLAVFFTFAPCSVNFNHNFLHSICILFAFFHFVPLLFAAEYILYSILSLIFLSFSFLLCIFFTAFSFLSILTFNPFSVNLKLVCFCLPYLPPSLSVFCRCCITTLPHSPNHFSPSSSPSSHFPSSKYSPRQNIHPILNTKSTQFYRGLY